VVFDSVTRLNKGFQPVEALQSFTAILCRKSLFSAIKEHFLGTRLAPDGTRSRHRIRNPARNVGENLGKGPAVDLFPVLQIGTRWHWMLAKFGRIAKRKKVQASKSNHLNEYQNHQQDLASAESGEKCT